MRRSLSEKDLLVGGTLLKRYLVGSRIASGSVSDVYLARQASVGNRNVAVRVLKKVLCVSDSAEAAVHRQRFAWEAELMAMLRSACFVRILDTGIVMDEVERPFMVLEYASGDSAARPISEGRRLTVPDAARVALGVAEGLMELHSYRVLYRDLSPANVIIEEYAGVGAPRLFDFSHATVEGVEPMAEGGGAGQLLSGTPPYAAPELSSGRGTVRSDVFSLGAMLYAMLTAEPPMGLRSASWQDYVSALSAGRKPYEKSMSRPGEKVPAKIEDVVRKALSVKPEERQASIAELATDLCDGLLSLPEIAGRTASPSLLTSITRILLGK